MDRQLDWIISPPNDPALPEHPPCATRLPQFSSQFHNDVVHTTDGSSRLDTALAQSLECTNQATDEKETKFPSAVWSDGSELAGLTTPESMWLSLSEGQNDHENLPSDDILGQLTDLQARPSSVQNFARVLGSYIGSMSSSHPRFDLSGDDVHEQTAEPQPWHNGGPLASFFPSGIPSNTGQDPLQQWLDESNSADLFTLNDDGALWIWGEKQEVQLPLNDMEDTGSSETSAMKNEVSSDGHRSQRTGITSVI
ncbi:hypothetical protein AYL99_00477 [Fonsecaea erecta]|uniref:Uncharacterized protein n=1 Tax=Fonsecaea erecta TaxID=1367422 RepID=A0A178ZZV0_9EURO|nr:hypothetical protein AYL99_00477 [Fonsecaea erecta]OAP64505.1 hypothetical protein AYL99_00477 [Fonsecaea erecta]